ncbi:MAG: cytochrome c biogenesis protein CcsA [Planctomycetota bacterium]
MTARVLALLIALITFPYALFAQTAPAGNAHPETEAVTNAEQEIPNPFGEPALIIDDTVEATEKHEFAQQIDVEPLAELAVSHGGRVKVMDTLARETVSFITGKGAYFDVVPDGEGGREKASYDPVFTLFDLIIDPAYYVTKPLIHVNYLPLRQAYLNKALPDDPETREGWKKLGKISPLMADRYGQEIFAEHEFEDPWREAAGRVFNALQLWTASENNMLLVTPGDPDLPWTHVSQLPDGHPAKAAALELGAAWRALDVERTNSAIAMLTQELRAIDEAGYPTTRIGLEMAYNRSNAFEWGSWLYFFSLLALLLAFGTGRKWLLVTGVTTLIIALVLHTLGFTARSLIAERFAIQNQFESMTGISLFAAIVGFALAAFRKQWIFAAAASATGFLVLITATQTGIPGSTIEREAAILNTSILLKYHVTTVLVSYGLITLAFIVSLFYLGTHYMARLKTPAVASVEARSSTGAALSAGPESVAAAALSPEARPVAASVKRTLKDLDSAQMIILQLAFWTLGVGILLGAWWADHSWGRWWAFDPKETWALITWIVYLIVIHLRFSNIKDRGLTTAWLSVIGFVVMLWTYFGVNLLLPGLHAYA